MKPNSSIPRRSALAIAAASAGLTLAVTATIAGGLGLIAPATSAPATSMGVEQPPRQPLVPVTNDRLASASPGSVKHSATSGAAAPPPRPDDARQAGREDDDDNDNRRTEKPRRVSPTGSSAERPAKLAAGRHHEEDDDD